jgi:hypothetical protein
MTSDAIRSKEEAQAQLRRLEQFYGAPVLPLNGFCKAISTWMDCIAKNNTDPALKRGGMEHGKEYYEFLNRMRIDIMKSNLLGRLLYAKEPLRTRMCPLHTLRVPHPFPLLGKGAGFDFAPFPLAPRPATSAGYEYH